MSYFRIDRSKCVRDGLCVRACPAKNLELDEQGYPRAKAGAHESCINCGHCMAACEKEAFELESMPLAQCETIPSDPGWELPQIRLFFKCRRSIRNYRKTPVPRATLDQVIDLARWAPTAKNGQVVRWLVLHSPEELKRFKKLTIESLRQANLFPGVVAAFDGGVDILLRDAPHVLVAYAAADALLPAIDCTIALTHAELAATAFGLGACWAGYLMGAMAQCPAVREALKLPAGYAPFGALMIGYPQFRMHMIPQRNGAQVDWR